MIWRNVFLEIALRAIKKVHLSHSPWQLKKQEVTETDLLRLNNSIGILLALETTVASEISNEFIYSSLTNGVILTDDKGNKEAKYYEVQREVKFDGNGLFNPTDPDGQKSKIVDLVLRRWNAKDLKYEDPVIMELKRYNLYSFDIRTGDVNPVGDNKGGISNDIEYLKVFRDKWCKIDRGEYSSHSRCLPYMLIWGRVASGKASVQKSELTRKFGIKEEDIYMKWMPLIIDESPQVTEWLWIALMEITPEESEDSSSTVE